MILLLLMNLETLRIHFFSYGHLRYLGIFVYMPEKAAEEEEKKKKKEKREYFKN